MLTLTPFISKTLHSKSNENMLRVTFVAFFIRNVLKQTQPKSDKKQKKFPTPIISKIDRQTDTVILIYPQTLFVGVIIIHKIKK